MNSWLEKLQKDLNQNKYNLKKVGLYSGTLKNQIEDLLSTLKGDYDCVVKPVNKNNCCEFCGKEGLYNNSLLCIECAGDIYDDPRQLM